MTASTVLVVTTSYDEAPRYVGNKLTQLGVPYFRFDTDRFPLEIEVCFDPCQGVRISDGDSIVASDQIRSVWYRRNVAPNLPDNLPSYVQEFCTREARAFLGGVWSSLPTHRWLSAPSAIWKAERKLYQLAVAHELGFTLPHTLVTNDQNSARCFADGRSLIAKAVSSAYVGRPSGNWAIFTSTVMSEDIADLDGLCLSPVTFQEKVDKKSDIRVTVIDGEVFAAEILSQADETSRVDWRATENPDIEHRLHLLPTHIHDLCQRLVRKLGLVFGAIDLALTSRGEYVFFEINPNGEWLWLEDRLGFPIADRIARWLSV